MDKFINCKELLSIVPYSRTHIWRLERDGLFPRRRKLGKKRVAWLQSEVNEWMAQRALA